MKKIETIAIIRPWLGGNNQYSLYITIPSKIVKQLEITEDMMLEVRLLEDQTIVISKHQENNKQPKNQVQTDSSSSSSSQSKQIKENDIDDSPNPLDGIEF